MKYTYIVKDLIWVRNENLNQIIIIERRMASKYSLKVMRLNKSTYILFTFKN